MKDWIDKPTASYRHGEDGLITHSVILDNTYDGLWRWDGDLYLSRELAQLAVEAAVERQRETREYERIVDSIKVNEWLNDHERNDKRRDLRRHVREFAAFVIGVALSATTTLVITGVAP